MGAPTCSEGLLPLDLLEQAVMTRFVPSQR
jgi:hypothetical protein